VLRSISKIRIELEEIENQLKKIDYIKEVVVIAREDTRRQTEAGNGLPS
jgi:long-subunit acyl-CoA synthetase (AMP-forming)